MATINKQHEAIIRSSLNIKNINREESYIRNQTAWFFRKKDSNWELSNMAGGMPVYYNKSKWNSSEQLYQACKYSPTVNCLPAQNQSGRMQIANVRVRIFAQNNARGAKMTQKCAVKAGMVRGDWDNPEWETRIHAMLWVLELKLYSNPLTFGKALKHTLGKTIVEVSRKDTFWGCKEYGNELRGNNVLGKLLVIVRNNYGRIVSGNFSYPDGFLIG